MRPTRPKARFAICLLLLALLLPACGSQAAQPTLLETQSYSIEKVDDHPLYLMHYYEDYAADTAQVPVYTAPDWACSLFAALGDPENLIYGRNFDWQPSPALLLYTAPPDGYASISMVNLGFLGFDDAQADDLLALSEADRQPLLYAPFLPIDGMNAAGLVVGMAAVPSSQDLTDPQRPVIGSLGIIRQMLDHADSVDEAVAIMEQYTIEFTGGPPVHYLIADADGNAVLVEYGTNQISLLPNDQPWHLATNFLLESVQGDPRAACWRYRTIAEGLEAAQGRLSPDDAMALLQAVSQGSASGTGTQWSAVYQVNAGALSLALGGRYDAVHTFYLEP